MKNFIFGFAAAVLITTNPLSRAFAQGVRMGIEKAKQNETDRKFDAIVNPN